MIASEQHPFPSRILVVDDEKSTRTAIGRALQLSGYLVDGAENGEQALKCLEESQYDVMLLDLNMPIIDGNQVMDVVRERYSHLQVIVLTAYATLDSAINAVKTGAVDYLIKPQSIAQINQAIQQALNRRISQSQRRHLIEIMGEAMQTLQNDDIPSENNEVKPDDYPKPIELDGMYFDRAQRKIITYEKDSDSNRSVVHTSELTAIQSAILDYMISHPMKVISCIEFSREALGYKNLSQTEAEKIVRPHIAKLRRKIEIDPSRPGMIRSVRGKGYIFSLT